MCNQSWSNLWLNKEKPVFSQILQEGFAQESEVFKNALAELTVSFKADIRLVIQKEDTMPKEGYQLIGTKEEVRLLAADERGVLYGIFALKRALAMGEDAASLNITEAPSQPLRMYNHWDNLDGSIERGYSGDSFFYKNDEIYVNERTKDYARLLASIAINGVVINNVNVKDAASDLITDRYFEKVAALANLFASYGITMYVSLNFASPIEIGGMDTCDPLEPAVISWWDEKMAEIFAKVPHLGGFLVKADSEGRPGPFSYGRTQAQGANMLAKAVKPYGGLILWRCFVYNCKQDWRDTKTDRARAAYDNFIGTDGDYAENVILQIKNGPMDFQIREPISPLFGGLQKTRMLLEVQVAQEYTGQQIDVCYLMPLFKEVLEFQTGADGDDLLRNRICGIAAVSNLGNDANWTGSALAAANFYGFGRLAFCHDLSEAQIAKEWILQTFGRNEQVQENILKILLPSRETYEKYTTPLGIGWMVTPHYHYGCSVDGYEYSPWGTYHRADHLGLGVDRTRKGTGYVDQYPEPLASMYNDVETCPEELLLFFHHLPYTYRLKSGKTLLQHIYDTHFAGVIEVEEMMGLWEALEGKIDAEAFGNVKERFAMQLENAREWRDQVNAYFYRKSGIPDEKGRTIY